MPMYNTTPPTAFVALHLAPGQFDLFDELLNEAEELMETLPASRSACLQDGDDLVFIDRDGARLGIGWVELPDADVLTLAVGVAPETQVSADVARASARVLRELIQRAEALFDAEQTLWQMAEVPLSTDTMDDHATRVALMDKPDAFVMPLAPEDAPALHPRLFPQELPHSDVLADVRAAIVPEEGPSVAMQVSAFALSTACLLVNPPVGASMLTYAALRQYEGMRNAEPALAH